MSSRTRTGRTRAPIGQFEPLEGRLLLSSGTSTRVRPQAFEVRSLAASVDRLIGTGRGRATGTPGTVKLAGGTGRLNGIGSIRFKGSFNFNEPAGDIIVTGPLNRAYRLSVENVVHTHRESRGVFSKYYTYDFIITYRVTASSDPSAPEAGKIHINAKLLKTKSAKFEGLFTSEFVPVWV